MNLPAIAFSVRQPWAWLIANGLKDVENRTWELPAKYVGRPVLLHASVKPNFNLSQARDILEELHAKHGLRDALRFPEAGRGSGGIVGVATFTGCTLDRVSPWCVPGQWHWRIADAAPLPFAACRGYLGFFRHEYALPEAQGDLMGVAS